ncbi:MAG: altronate dehydratase family protein [Chthoniobacteraceae bacterium]|nr:altronate dehydratase family protein [Chthoniobacteraceae bacterium]
MSTPLLRIHPADNVAVALEDLEAGRSLPVGDACLTLSQPIPRGHKVALADIGEKANVIKYGSPIGHATEAIPAGAWVHSHNIKTNLSGMLEYAYRPQPNAVAPRAGGPMFDGFKRPNGDVGIRNELWILPTVGCVNHVAEALAKRFGERLPHGTVDGVYAFTHPYGCSQLGEDHATTRRLLASLAHHPNAGGVLVIGLGCENNTMAGFREALGDADSGRYRFLVSQQVEDEMETGLQLLEELAQAAGAVQREPVPVSALRVGLKCGGSDGLSGITANPLVGSFSDLLIASGGTSVLTEVPEMFGAETLLMNRCATREIYDKCVGMVNGFKEYFLRHNQVVYENPSPGNKDGGITTLEEKSLGCTQKGGCGQVVDVLEYGGRLEHPGLNLLNGPGNDIVAVTALAAAGAHVILFTTGRGTPLGGCVPTVKVSTNSELAAHKKNWIDFDAGELLHGTTREELTARLFLDVLAIASGQKRTKAEINGFREIAIFKDGVTL